MPKAPEKLRDFDSLLKVVEFLRGPEGCPWDKEQTHQSLTRFAIEEAFELSEAIDSKNKDEIKEELGDLLLQVVLHSEIARQEKTFDIHDVIQILNEKMIRRHPHVFGDKKVNSSAEVLSNWADIKAAEKGQSSARPTWSIPAGLPALVRAQKIGDKTEKIGFDWPGFKEVWTKVREEFGELEAELDQLEKNSPNNKHEHLLSELGDLMFTLAQLARHLKGDAEQILRQTNRRFESRFTLMQDLIADDGMRWTDLSPAEKETYWQKAKAKLIDRSER
ncbi:MAG: nucleoside triphosphate pyrophosphohydrolase [Bdellovibrionales bacterium]